MATAARLSMGEPDDVALAEIRSLYDASLYLRAFAVARRFGDPFRWRSPAACVMAARLWNNLGGRRAAQALFLRARRLDRGDPEAAYFYTLQVLERHGPLAAWDLGSRLTLPPFRHHLLRAEVLTELRDFSAAGKAFAEAEALAPDDSWLSIDKTRWLARQDRREEALATVRELLRRIPHHRAGVQFAASLLQELGRPEEAHALLDEASAHIESYLVLLMRASLETNLGRHHQAWRSYREAVALVPCLDAPGFRWFCAAFSAAAYRADDVEASIRFARGVGEPMFERLADRLAAQGPPSRIELPVPFVQQDHNTCAPATLASIARFHDIPATHVEIAEEICFDGTSAGSERRWAEEHGFVCRELTVTWESARALIDAGIPFTLTTIGPTSAHLQAVMGYDARRRSLLVRDPSVPSMVEHDVDDLALHQAWAGPRGMALVPRDQAGRLDSLPFPEAALYDAAYALERALRRHDRDAAQRALETLRRDAPDHHVTGMAARALANYDDNPVGLLEVLERQLALHPAAAALRLAKLSCLRGLARAGDRTAMLEELVANPDTDPLFGRMLAEDLTGDARRHAQAERLFRRALRYHREDAVGYFNYAWLLVDQQRWDQAAEVFRFAACLDETLDAAAFWHFAACRIQGKTHEAIAFLEDRVARRGRRFSEPARTLHRCLDALGRTGDGVEVLERALAVRPDDAELRLYLAEELGRLGRRERARALLAEASDGAKRTRWDRVAAQLALLEGDLVEARARYEDVLAVEPLAFDAHQERLRLIASLEGPAAARGAAEEVAARFPYHRGLARLRVDWTVDEGDAGLDALRQAIVVAPDDVVARRELVFRLGQRHRFAEAEAELAEVEARAPRAAATLYVQGLLLEWQGLRDRARESYRAAVAADADDVAAIVALASLGRDPAERRSDLAVIRDELRRQVIFGNGLAAYRRAALGDEPAEATLAFLQEAQAARPDLPEVWIALTAQLSELSRHDEARRLAEEVCRRFPLRPGPQLARAAAERAAGRREAERAALEEAMALAPGATDAVRLLAESHLHSGDLARARELLERASARAPLDLSLHGALAEVLWNLPDRDAALGRLQLALRLDPSYFEGWDRLAEWAARAGRRDPALAFARELTRARPASASAHFGLASLLASDEDFDERLAALDAAVTHAPRFHQAHDARALMLADLGRYDEAIAACAPPAFGKDVPSSLRGRAAWIEWQRGDRARAIELMEAVVADAPSYAFGWRFLGRWRMARGDRAGAKTAFTRLFALVPTTATILFDFHIDDDELAAARAVLDRLRQEMSEASLRPAAVRLAVASGKPGEAIEIMLAMASVPGVELRDLDWAAGLIAANGGEGRLALALEHAVTKPDAPAPLGYLWGRHGSARTFRGWWRALTRRRQNGQDALTAMATAAYIERVGESGRNAWLWLLTRFHGDVLRADTLTWGTVGYALVTCGWMRTAARWLADWRGREDLEPWILFNVVLASLAIGADDEARAASVAALGLPSDRTLDRHRCWLALDAALRAPLAEAQRVVAAAPITEDGLDLFMVAAAKAALAARDPTVPPELRPGLVGGLLEECRAATTPRSLRRARRRLLRAVTTAA